MRRGWGSAVWRNALMRSAVGVVARAFFAHFLCRAQRKCEEIKKISIFSCEKFLKNNLLLRRSLRWAVVLLCTEILCRFENIRSEADEEIECGLLHERSIEDNRQQCRMWLGQVILDLRKHASWSREIDTANLLCIHSGSNMTDDIVGKRLQTVILELITIGRTARHARRTTHLALSVGIVTLFGRYGLLLNEASATGINESTVMAVADDEECGLSDIGHSIRESDGRWHEKCGESVEPF